MGCVLFVTAAVAIGSPLGGSQGEHLAAAHPAYIFSAPKTTAKKLRSLRRGEPFWASAEKSPGWYVVRESGHSAGFIRMGDVRAYRPEAAARIRPRLRPPRDVKSFLDHFDPTTGNIAPAMKEVWKMGKSAAAYLYDAMVAQNSLGTFDDTLADVLGGTADLVRDRALSDLRDGNDTERRAASFLISAAADFRDVAIHDRPGTDRRAKIQAQEAKARCTFLTSAATKRAVLASLNDPLCVDDCLRTAGRLGYTECLPVARHFARSVEPSSFKTGYEALARLARPKDPDLEMAYQRAIKEALASAPDRSTPTGEEDETAALAVAFIPLVEGGEGAHDLLRRLARSSSLQARRAASFTIAQNGERSDVALLLYFVNDEDSHVRLMVVAGVAALGGTSSIPKVREFSHSTDFVQRMGAALGFGAIGAPEAFPDMVRLSHDSVYYVRIAVANALGAFPGPETTSILRKLQADPNPNVGRAAQESLRRLGGR